MLYRLLTRTILFPRLRWAVWGLARLFVWRSITVPTNAVFYLTSNTVVRNLTVGRNARINPNKHGLIILNDLEIKK